MDYNIRFDLHTHSIASGHGSMDTISMLAKAAANKGLTTLGISDHGPTTPGSASLSYFRGLSFAPKNRFGVRLLYGVEANICDYNGRLDVPNEILENLDYGIASMHMPMIKPSDMDTNTTAYLRAMEHPKVRFIGHCDDVKYPVDFEVLLKGAIKNHVFLELNNASLAPNGYRGETHDSNITLLKLHMKYQYPLLLSSDSHGVKDVGNFQYIYPLLQEVKFPKELILNSIESSI